MSKLFYFCKLQYSNKSDAVGLGGCCNLLLVEGVASSCPYSLKDIYVKDIKIKGSEIHLAFGVKNNLEDECLGFKIGGIAEKRIMEFLCNELKALNKYSLKVSKKD